MTPQPRSPPRARRLLPEISRPLRAALWLACAWLTLAGHAQPGPSIARSIADLRGVSDEQRQLCDIDLEATAWFVDPASGALILHDESGAAEARLDWGAQTIRPGDRLRIAGRATVSNLGKRFELNRLPTVDNDGLHSEEERSGALWLDAGRHPIRVEWFNAIGEPGLRVEFSGPGIERQPIPDTFLSRPQPDSRGGETRWLPGLAFRAFHERWWSLPASMAGLVPAQQGSLANFDVAASARPEFVGMEFTGFLQIQRPGEYRFYLLSDDGSRLYIGPSALSVARVGFDALPEPIPLHPGQAMSGHEDYAWARLEGQVTRVSKNGQGAQLTLTSGLGQTRVEFADASALRLDSLRDQRITVVGIARASQTLDGIPAATTLFAQDASQLHLIDASSPGEASEPLAITPVETIERLGPDRLDGRYRARIQGVVINAIPGGYAAVIQDRNRAMFIDLNRLRPGPIQLGDLLDVEGIVEPGEFSPIIKADQMRRLGPALMPEPLEATRDELINGSLHSQYVEIEGYVLAVEPKSLTLRSRAGVLNIGLETETSPEWLNAVIRMRGCLRLFWDAQSRQIEVGKMELNSAEISIARAPPNDLFDVARKRASELLKFDPNAGSFQRVGLLGQALYASDDTLYLMEDGRGVRVSLAAPIAFERGDWIEVAGFPEFGGPSPHFAHAVARNSGQGALPPPNAPPADRLLDGDYDSTWVSVEGELIGIGFQEGKRAMQLRAGPNVFSATIADSSTRSSRYEPGSRLRLTGVYAGLGGNRALGQPIEAFELMLARASDVQVLATPPWWTMPRLLALVGTLCVVLLIAVVWIKALQRQVAARTEQLSIALQERHRVEQEEAVARERSRLAYDLHDELGAGLTEVGLLGALATTASLPEEKRASHLARLTDTVRRLVMALDEIVWAVNPKYDTVSSFVGYYTSYAQSFLELAGVRCRFDVAEELPEEPLTSRVRHSLFLAFKETLNNVARHAHATEVVIRIHQQDGRLIVSVSDNGCGLTSRESSPAADGLASIGNRLGQLGGHCSVESNTDTGTTLSLVLPLQ